MVNNRAKLITCAVIMMLTPHTEGLVCSASYLSRGEHTCYRVLKINSTRNEAQIMCSKDGGHLAGIRSADDNQYYDDIIRQEGLQRAWIGLKRETPPHPVWRNIKDNSRVVNQGCYRHDPDNTDFVVDARYVFLNATTHDKCLNFCRESFPNGSVQYAALTDGMRCGCGPGDFSKEKPFNSGRKNSAENGCTRECTGSYNRGNTMEKMYCGGAQFMTILEIGGTGYSTWAYNQPNNFDPDNDVGYQTCATIDTIRSKNKLNDEECHKYFPYICQNASGQFIVKTTPSDWFSARYDCLQDGGDLAGLQDQADMDLLVNNYLNKETKYWTGLTSLFWYWQFGDIVRYTGWSPGEPNQVQNTCGYLDSGHWYDARCEGEYKEGFICEHYDPPLTTTTTDVPSITAGSGVTTRPGTGSRGPGTGIYSTTHHTQYPQGTTVWPTSSTAPPSSRVSVSITDADRTTHPLVSPTAGKSSLIAGFSIIEFVLTVLFAALALIVVLLIIVVVCTKHQNNKKNRINVNKPGGARCYTGYNGHGYDVRGLAAMPYNGYLREEVYIPASDFGSTGSHADLLQSDIPERPRCEPSPGPDRKIKMDEYADDTLSCKH